MTKLEKKAVRELPGRFWDSALGEGQGLSAECASWLGRAGLKNHGRKPERTLSVVFRGYLEITKAYVIDNKWQAWIKIGLTQPLNCRIFSHLGYPAVSFRPVYLFGPARQSRLVQVKVKTRLLNTAQSGR
jgi:hypothetical protein